MCETCENSLGELRQMLADCEKYLKEGETPAQRIERERRDTEALLNMLIREKRKTKRMLDALRNIAQHFSSEWPERCQTERADCSGCAGFCCLAQSSGADPARLGEPPERCRAMPG